MKKQNLIKELRSIQDQIDSEKRKFNIVIDELEGKLNGVESSLKLIEQIQDITNLTIGSVIDDGSTIIQKEDDFAVYEPS